MKEPNPDCEMCEGTGIVSMDDSMEGYGFSAFDCDCTKED